VSRPGTLPRWVDSHCHIQDGYLEDPAGPGPVLERAAAAGVGGLVCVGTDPAASRAALALARERGAGRPAIWATAGLHPHEAAAGVDETLSLLEEAKGGAPGLVAVGECGLDFHYDRSPRPQQLEAFAAQIRCARRLDLALVVHTRSAFEETAALLATEGLPERTVIHCFTGGPDEARRFLDLGCYLSFSGIVTFKGVDEVREAARRCPTDRLLVETDSPFLAPAPRRGQRNEPALVALVGEAVAELRGVPAAALAEATSENAARAFRLEL